MATTSKKHQNFVREPMYRGGDPKPVTELAGVGEKAGSEFKEVGISFAHEVLGNYLAANENEESFHAFLKENAPCLNSKHREDCYKCLKEWTTTNL